MDCVLKFSVKRIGRYSTILVQLKAWVDCSVHDLTNCTIGSLTVNVRPIFNVQSAEKVDKEFDELVQDADFDY